MNKYLLENSELVSVCIPAYNCGLYIQQTLISLCHQTYNNIEIIVVNDGSTDDTLSKIENLDNDKIKLITVANGGASRARNVAFKNSKGSLIVFFDADDLVDQDYLFYQVQALNRKKNAVVLAQWGRFTNNLATFQLIPNPKNSMTLETWVREFWYHVNPMTNPGRALIPRDIIEKAGLWNEKLNLNDDLEFFTRIFERSESIVFNNKSTLYYRSGINGLSGINGAKAFVSLYNSVKLSTEIVLRKYNNVFTQKACANMWQSIIYLIYLYDKPVLKLCKKELTSLPKPDFDFPAGGTTRLLIKILGWKTVINLKFKIHNARNPRRLY